MKNAPVAKLVDVELQAFELDAVFARRVLDEESSEVWKPGGRTNTGELGAVKFDRIAPMFRAIRKAFELRFSNNLLAVWPFVNQCR